MSIGLEKTLSDIEEFLREGREGREREALASL